MYGVMYEVDASIEVYDRVSARIDERRAGARPEGLLMHVGVPTAAGFRIVEVWESKEHSDRFGAQYVGPAIAELGEQAAAEQTVLEFEPHGLLVAGDERDRMPLPGARRATEDVATPVTG